MYIATFAFTKKMPSEFNSVFDIEEDFSNLLYFKVDPNQFKRANVYLRE